jgi:hypothetical protein
MNINDLFETLDQSHMQGFYDVEDLGYEFGLSGGICYNMRIENDFKECKHRDVTWMCTDTLVGIFFLFLNDEFVGLRIQTARKSDSHFYWKNATTYDKVKNWFWCEFQKQNECPSPSFVDFTQDLSDYNKQSKQQSKQQ